MTGTISAPPTALLTTNFDEIDRAIASLHNNRDQWVQTTIPQRLEYLQDCLDRTLNIAEIWATAGCEAKGIATAKAVRTLILKHSPSHRADNQNPGYIYESDS